ncbi:MAG: hypothetical protein JHD02_06370 [Thermoleophilaceae bacterium]|nr:hypothetical protein [Thermoleophilaceae bacterium]
MPFKLPLLALTILALALAGCGSSTESTESDSAATAPKPLTKAALISKADAICKSMQVKLDEIPPPESIEDLEAAIGKQIEVSGPAIKKLAALVPPEDLAAKYDAWTAKLEELQAGTVRVREAAGDGSQAQVQKVIEEVDQVNTKADEIGKQIGFKVCVK